MGLEPIHVAANDVTLVFKTGTLPLGYPSEREFG